MEISMEHESCTPTGGTGLKDLSNDILLRILGELDAPSLNLLGSADKQLRDFVEEAQIWSDRCKIWEKEVNLGAWSSQMESGKALYRLLNSLSRLVGSWKHQSTDPRGEMIYITWGDLAVEAWKVVPYSHQTPHRLSDMDIPLTFEKFFQVVGLRDGSHRVELANREAAVDILVPFPHHENSFQLQVYHEQEPDRGARRDELDESSGGLSLGKRLWSVARQYFGFSSSLKEDRRYTQSRVYERLTYDEPQPGQEWAGLYYGFYGGHGCEVVTVSYTEDGLILGTKVLGDVNVPSGQATFKAYISTERAMGQEGKFFLGKAMIADEPFMNSSWVDGYMVTLGNDKFYFHWTPLYSTISFHRLDLDTRLRKQRDAESNIAATDSNS